MKLRKAIALAVLIFIMALFSPNSSDANILYKNKIIKYTPDKVQTLIDTYNFDKVDEYYFRGGQPDEDDFINFAKLGIKTVINLRDDDVNEFRFTLIAKKYGIKYVNIPMKPSEPPGKEQRKQFFAILNNPENLPVFVHCRQGKDRTGIMTALYRIKYYKWDFKKTYQEMKEKGYHSLIFPEQKQFLYQYMQISESNL